MADTTATLDRRAGVAVTADGHPRVELREHGTYAATAFAAGEVIGIFRGRELTASEAVRLEDAGEDAGLLWVETGERAIDVTNALRLVAGDEPSNAEWDLNSEDEPELTATRAIAPGEKIVMPPAESDDWEFAGTLPPTSDECADLRRRLTIRTPSPGAALDDETLATAATLFEAFGCLVVRDAFPRELMAAVRDEFLAEQASFLDTGADGALTVGDQRVMVTVPVAGAANDPRLYAPASLLPLLERVISPELHLASQVAVCSLPGAEAQHVHADHPFLFDIQTPTYAVTVIAPLVDVTEQLGATRLWPGTHTLMNSDDDVVGRADRLPFVEPYPRMGDAVLMDFYLLHSGRPNTGDGPRPVLYNIYGQPWWRDSVNYTEQRRLEISDEVLDGMTRRHRRLFLES